MASEQEESGGLPTPWSDSTGRRLAFSVLAGAIVGGAILFTGEAKYAPAVGWDAAAITLLVLTWLRILPLDAREAAIHSTREDPTRAVSDILLLFAAVASLAGVGFFLLQARAASGAAQDLLAGVGVGTVALSWLVVHTVFTLRYAMLYYAGPHGCVNFNQPEPPRYLDFAYLAFSIGMTYQVSDTDLETSEIRATALRHAFLSFLFGTLILATMVNLVAGLGSTQG